MNTYIAILRGINVSGQKLIKMQDLKLHLGKFGFFNIKTYIQSGNIIFSSNELNAKKIEADVVKCIKANFGFEVPVIIRKTEEWIEVVSNNPFIKQPEIEIDKLHVVFLEKELDKVYLSKVEKKDFTPDEFLLNKKEIYLYCPHGYAKTKLSNNFFEKVLNQKATTRNWKTVNKILEIAIN